MGDGIVLAAPDKAGGAQRKHHSQRNNLHKFDFQTTIVWIWFKIATHFRGPINGRILTPPTSSPGKP
jgi:hypothetical protein